MTIGEIRHLLNRHIIDQPRLADAGGDQQAGGFVAFVDEGG
jgi:hypothetical protein